MFIKTKQKFLSLLLALCMALTLVPMTAFAAENTTEAWDGTADTSWYDETKTEFHITTAEQLAGLATIVNTNTDIFEGKTVYLENDLDLSGHEWISIGNGANVKTTTFAGLFDGKGHCIYNLYSHEDTVSGTNETNRYRSGLFGTLYRATIQNLGIENADISVSDNDASTYGKGILTDSIYGSTIRNCWTTGTISGGSEYDKYIGGLIGFVYGGTNNITGCYSSAEITGNYGKDGDFFDSLGGIVGMVWAPTVVISDCWFDGKITVNSAMAATGGIAGYTEGAAVKNCMVTTTDIGTDGENTCWIAYSIDTAAENCFWPKDNKYMSSVFNAENGVSAGTEVDNFRDNSILESLNKNAADDVEWVMGIEHPTFRWDDNNIPANYEAVDAAVKKAEMLNKDEYTNFSEVEAAINAVDRSKSVRQQDEVDAMAKAIEYAIAKLEKKAEAATPTDTGKQTGVKRNSSATSPETGNDSNIALWIAFVTAASSALSGTVLYNRKRKYSK